MQTLHRIGQAFQDHSDEANDAYCEICAGAAVDLSSTLEFVMEVMKIDRGIESMHHLACGPISSMLNAFSIEKVSEALSKLEPSLERDALFEFMLEN